MAYHLSREARDGLVSHRIPRDMRGSLFEFQAAAVQIAAHHVKKRGGVLIGDVVGLGKTLMATAVVRVFEEEEDLETLIICPKNLVRMWEDYRERYRLRARILPYSRVTRELPNLRRYRLVVIDESHNLRNREGKRYRAIQEYIRENESKVVLLSATPYNKTYLDLSSQLRLFLEEGYDLGVRPERLIRELGQVEFERRFQFPVRSLNAFEQSAYADDWRELMRLFMVRRTRSFIKANYAEIDPANGRSFLRFEGDRRVYFPDRVARTLAFAIDETDPADQYARLYAPGVVEAIADLSLPRYGLGEYVSPTADKRATPEEKRVLANLSRAGKRLMGFSRTNLFKRLESSGQAFLQSIERHVLRNYIFLHALEHGLDIPIGTQDAGLLDSRTFDADVDALPIASDLVEDESEMDEASRMREEVENKLTLQLSAFEERAASSLIPHPSSLRSEADFKRRAAAVYALYGSQYRRRFTWVRADLFVKTLARDLRRDAQELLRVLQACGMWEPAQDRKLQALVELLAQTHPQEKVLVFTQFADTVEYLSEQLPRLGISAVVGVTGDSDDPTTLAWRFSPESNGHRRDIPPEHELRVLIATDVLSEG